MTLNRKLHELRGKKPMYFIAFKSGLNPETLRSMECRGNVSVQALYWYCKLFNANADELLGTQIKGTVTKSDYKRINVDGKEIRLHRIQAEKKLGRKLEPGEVVHHKDGDMYNNSLKNLEIMTASEHGKMHADNLRRRRRPVMQYNDSGDIKRWECADDVFRAYGWWASSITRACRGQLKTAYGYCWKYL